MTMPGQATDQPRKMELTNPSDAAVLDHGGLIGELEEYLKGAAGLAKVWESEEKIRREALEHAERMHATFRLRTDLLDRLLKEIEEPGSTELPL